MVKRKRKIKKFKRKNLRKMNYEENLKKLCLKIPEAKGPVGNYVATKISGKILFVSGQISICLLYTSPSPRDRG